MMSPVVPTFVFIVSSQTLDEGEDEQDDEGGHANPSESGCSACKEQKFNCHWKRNARLLRPGLRCPYQNN